MDIVESARISSSSSGDRDEKIMKLKYKLGLMKSLASDFVIKCENVFVHEGRYHIILEHMARGELSRFIYGHKRAFSSAFCKYAIYCVAVALKEMHDLNIIHRDIRSCNILVNSIGDIKLAEPHYAVFLT